MIIEAISENEEIICPNCNSEEFNFIFQGCIIVNRNGEIVDETEILELLEWQCNECGSLPEIIDKEE